MTIDPTKATRPVRVAFLNCFDATLFSADVHLSREDEARLTALLAWLQDAGILILPKPPRGWCGSNFSAVIAHLRGAVGAHVVEAGLAAGPALPNATRSPPAAVMPIWPFEPEGSSGRDILVSSGRLWGVDILLEAFRVDDPDSPESVSAVRSRFDRWVWAAGGRRLRAVIHPPGEEGCYILAAMTAPA